MTQESPRQLVGLLEYLVEKRAWAAVPDQALALFRQHQPELEKSAESDVLRQLGEALQFFPGQTLGVPSRPAPLASMLAGGMLGLGLGYGAGTLGEALLPRRWERGRLRRNLALAGGTLGALPGGLWALANRLDKRHWNDPKLLQPRGYDPQEAASYPLLWDEVQKRGWASEKVAQAFSQTGYHQLQPINVDEFNRVIWRDPRVSGPLPPSLQAAASGLVTGAANLPGKSNSRLVTPLDIGRMAAGMGAGYVSGALVGKALGALMGLPDTSQERLKNVGLWAGLIRTLVPAAYGG